MYIDVLARKRRRTSRRSHEDFVMYHNSYNKWVLTYCRVLRNCRETLLRKHYVSSGMYKVYFKIRGKVEKIPVSWNED